MNLDKLQFPNLIDEFANYGTNRAIIQKAKRIVKICIERKKYTLAEKISRKYSLDKKSDDFINATSLAFLAKNRNINQK